MVKYLPKLEKVEIMDRYFGSTADFRSLESLSVLALVSSQITAFPLLPESIQVLNISQNSKIRWSLQDIAASPLPNLETLVVDDNTQIENTHVLRF